MQRICVKGEEDLGKNPLECPGEYFSYLARQGWDSRLYSIYGYWALKKAAKASVYVPQIVRYIYFMPDYIAAVHAYEYLFLAFKHRDMYAATLLIELIIEAGSDNYTTLVEEVCRRDGELCNMAKARAYLALAKYYITKGQYKEAKRALKEAKKSGKLKEYAAAVEAALLAARGSMWMAAVVAPRCRCSRDALLRYTLGKKPGRYDASAPAGAVLEALQRGTGVERLVKIPALWVPAVLATAATEHIHLYQTARRVFSEYVALITQVVEVKEEELLNNSFSFRLAEAALTHIEEGADAAVAYLAQARPSWKYAEKLIKRYAEERQTQYLKRLAAFIAFVRPERAL